MWKQRHEEVKKFVQGHKACKWTGLYLNSSNLVPKFVHPVIVLEKKYSWLIYFHNHKLICEIELAFIKGRKKDVNKINYSFCLPKPKEWQ